MKRHLSDKRYFKLLGMLDDFAQSEGLSIKDEVVIDKFVECLSRAVREHQNNQIRVHGFHVQSMFAHVAAALGKSQIITEEDSGVFFSSENDIRRPDFRLVTKGGDQFLIEVKNFHQKDPMKPLIIKSAYLSTLKKYADAFKIPLKIAIFWSVWKLWTLVDPSHFISDNSEYILTMPEAMKRNEMILLGDHMIGTSPPLTLRLYADPNKPRSVGKKGQVHFTIGRVAFYACGKEITDEFEEELAWFFMLYGKWNDVNHTAEIKNGLLEYTEVSVSPEQYDKKQDFATLGFLSELITSNYNFLTSRQGEILQLTPKQQPDKLSIFIPHDYKGKVLRLWQFYVKPNFKDLTKK